MLIEVNGADPVLIVFDIGSDDDYKIIRAHIAQETDKTAFIKFYKFF